MGRFVGKLAVGGRLLDETIGGSIHEAGPVPARSEGRVALSHAVERLARAACGPIHLIAEDGPTLRVELGRSQAVGDLYVVVDFVGVEDAVGDTPIFSIRAYPDLRAPGRPDEAPTDPADEDEDDAGAVLLAFPPAAPGRRRRACSDGR